MSAARRNLKKADDEIADSTYRKRISGLCSLGHPARDGEARSSFGSCGVDPTSLREEGKPYLRRSPLWSAHTGLLRQQCRGTGPEKSAEAIVAAAAVGPRRRAEFSIAGSRLEDPRAGQPTTAPHPIGSYRVVRATAQQCGGTDLLCQWRLLPPRHPEVNGPWRLHAARSIEETAVYIKVRTVVWEDGVARPLLPDRGALSPAPM